MRHRNGVGIGLLVACALLYGCDEPPGATGPSAAASVRAQPELAGRWVPEVARSDHWTDAPHVRFEPDGTWRGSDGCNGLSGRWRLDPDGGFAASSDPHTEIGCDNVDLGVWLAQARTVHRDGDVLALREAGGGETGRLRRAA